MHLRVGFILALAISVVALAPSAARAACVSTFFGVSPSVAAPGQTVTATSEGAAGCPPPSASDSYNIKWGDGAQSTVSNTSSTVTHAYAAGGIFTVTFNHVDAFGISNLLASQTVTIASIFGSLTSSPPIVTIGEPVVFNADATVPLFGITVILYFGDGTQIVPVSFPATISHRYSSPGTFTAKLVATSTFGLFPPITLATTVTHALGETRVPLGTITDTLAATSPIFSGGTTNLLVHFRITSPYGINPNGETALQALVDLLDARGHLVRRSDPFPLFVPDLNPNALQTAIIPYTVPVDGAGWYRLVIWIRTIQGGTVAVGPGIPFYIVGGADPAPAFKNQIKAAGALVSGGPLLVGGGGGGSINIGMTTALQWPTYSLAISGLYDPISHKSDPVFNLSSSTPGPVAAPDAQTSTSSATPPAPARLKYADIIGRAQAALPAMLGGGETLHGLDFTYDYTNVIFHAAAGYTQLKSATTGERRGGLFDFTRAWSQSDSLRFTLTDNRDDTGSFISVGGANPLDGRTGYLEWSEAFGSHLKSVFTGARSISKDLVTLNNINDGADKVDFAYSNATDTYEIEYHNAGALFATGAGLGATADSVGGSVSAQLGLSSISQLGLNFKHEDRHSVFSRDGFMGSTLTISPPGGIGVTFTLSSDRQLSASSDTTTNQVGFAFQRSYADGTTWNVTTNVTDGVDQLNRVNDAATRTVQAQYAFRRGPHSFGFGLNGSSVSGSSPNTTSSESFNYGYTFGPLARGLGQLTGPTATRKFEIQLAATHINTVQPADTSQDQSVNARLSFHLTPQLAPGVVFIGQRHVDVNSPEKNTTQAAAGFRLDLQI